MLTLAYLDHWNDLNIEMISLDQYKVPWSVSFNITQLIISLKNTPHHVQKSPLSQRTLPPYIILYWHHSRTGMTHKAHKTFVDARKSAAIKRHIKIFMLILTHLLPVFGFKMTSLENFTKWNCSQRMTRMSLYEAQIFLQNPIFLTHYHYCHQKSFPDHLRQVILSFPSHFVFEFF